MLQRFDGSYIMAIAAYNAGANRVDQWVRDYGDPRTGEIDPVDWVELIPYRETRNYVQRVMENMMVYRNRLTGADLEVTMVEDLARGNGQPPVMLASVPDATAPADDTLNEVDQLEDNDRNLDPEIEGLEDFDEDASVPDPKPLDEIAETNVYEPEGQRVIIPVDSAGAPPALSPTRAPRETLRAPEVRVWAQPESCAARALSSGNAAEPCDDQ
jgi:hypothetical protein